MTGAVERTIHNPPELAPPVGFSHGVATRGGRVLWLAGQNGTDGEGRIATPRDLVAQTDLALANLLAVVLAAGGGPRDVVKLGIYVTNLGAYRSSRAALGPVWRRHFGRYYPALMVLGVTGFFDPAALVEIDGVAVIEDGPGGVNFELTEAQRAVRDLARRFAEDEVAPLARAADETGAFPIQLVARMGQLGFLAGPVETALGGAGMDYVSFALVYEELGRADSSVRGFLSVHGGLVTLCIRDHGTDVQKRDWLPRLASGAAIGCYCLTEPGAGSDAAAIEATARRDGGDYVLDGTKVWITNGGIADLALVFARDPDLPAERQHRQICAFLIPTDTPGFERSDMPGHELGHRASDHAVVTLRGCRVPASAMLGPPGGGFRVAMAALDHGRLGVAAGAVGVARACLDASVAFARRRRAFGRRIGDFEMIQAALADMAADTDAARLLVHRAAWLKDRGAPTTRETSIAKLFATEAALRAADQAVLIHGGRGYSTEYPVERMWRDVKGLQIYEGTSHIQRIVIARQLLGREQERSG